MFLRKYWIGLTVFLVAIVGAGLYYLQTRPSKDPVVIIKPVEPLPKSEVAEVVEGDTSQGGHRHADGTWHDEQHAPIVEVSDDTQQSEVVQKRFSVAGEVDIMQMPELPADIDPDDIPPFYSIAESGARHHYNRPLTARERALYGNLKTDPSFKGVPPAGLKMSAIILVRQEKVASGALKPVFQGIANGSLTTAEGKALIDEFYERTR